MHQRCGRWCIFGRAITRINGDDRRESAVDKQYLSRHVSIHNGRLVRHKTSARPNWHVHGGRACYGYHDGHACCGGYAGHACCVDRTHNGDDDRSAHKNDDHNAAAGDAGVYCDDIRSYPASGLLLATSMPSGLNQNEKYLAGRCYISDNVISGSTDNTENKTIEFEKECDLKYNFKQK